MQAIWLENRSVSLRAVPEPEPGPDEALIDVLLAGVCATDLELIRGYYPYTGVLGHEFVGVVADAPGHPEWLGRRVVGEINAVCGDCPACRRGDRSHCRDRTVLGIVNRDGAFAKRLILPIENLHRVPDTVPDTAAVFAEPLAAAFEILEQVRIGSDQRVLLVGAGRLGQMIARVLYETGCDLTVLARYPVQRELLAAAGIPARGPDDHGLTNDFDIVVEATGSQAGFQSARSHVRPRGTIVLKSTYRGSVQVDFSSMVVDEITLIGSRCGPFEPALKALAEKRVDPTPLIQAVHPLSEGLKALDNAGKPGVLKILIGIGPA